MAQIRLGFSQPLPWSCFAATELNAFAGYGYGYGYGYGGENERIGDQFSAQLIGIGSTSFIP